MGAPYKLAAASGVTLSLLMRVVLVSAVAFTKQVDFETPSHPNIRTVQDGGSLCHLLTEVGLDSFSCPVARIVTINSTLFTLNYTNRGSMMLE